MTRVLVVDDEEVLARTICSYLRKRDVEAIFAVDASDAVTKFRQMSPDITFLDFKLGRDDGVEVLRRIRAIKSEARVVMMTGHGDIAVAVQAMKAGAQDFMTKPVPLATIATIVSHFGHSAKRRTIAAPTAAVRPASASILGRSGPIEETRRTMGQILAASNATAVEPPPVLITGESGTGKELVARALHEGGPRATGPFVAVNCASLPAELVESELFGHERGAFTDAKSAKTGLFEAANNGVLFLDEVGDMPLDAQAKLLRVLENRSFRRVGGVNEQSVDVWVIAATNRNLADCVAEHSFRADLMFRLQVLWVDLPPLRQRDADVLLLAEHFLSQAAAKYCLPVPEFSADARAKLVAHSWPGNIRELRNVVERTVLTARSVKICPEDIRLPESVPSLATASTAGTTLRDVEVSTLRNALVRSDGNVSQAAGLLGISRDTLRYRMSKFGLGRSQ